MRSLAAFFIWGLATAVPALSAITNVRVMGTTATQAVLSYTAPGLSACGIEVSESPTYRPLVHDVNPDLFPSSGQDRRAGSIASGKSRLVVIGKHGMMAPADNPFLASDGNRYSRALQADTLHYYRVTCGADTAAGSFRTANIQFGSTYPEPLPADGTTPGAYNWPSILSATDRSQAIVDPTTGALIRKITMASESDLASNNNSWPSGGMYQLCSHVLTQADGHTYNLCFVPAANRGTLYAIETDTGNAYALSRLFVPYGFKQDGNKCGSVGVVGMVAFSPTDARKLYFVSDCANGNGPQVFVARWSGALNASNPALASDYVTAPAGLQLVLLTPNSGLGVMFNAYDSRYDSTHQTNLRYFGLAGIQRGKLILSARLTQDGVGWIFVFDPGNDLPIGSGGTGGIVAANPFWQAPVSRWCSIHTLVPVGDASPWATVVSNTLGRGGGGAWAGPYSVTLANSPGTTGTTFQLAATNGSYEPQSPNTPNYLQNAAVGDLLWTSLNGYGEYIEIAGIDPVNHTWTVIRGNQLAQSLFVQGSSIPPRTTTPVALNAGASLYMACRAVSMSQKTSGGYWYWNFVNDPHGVSIRYPAVNGTTSDQVVENAVAPDHWAARDGYNVSDAMTRGIMGWTAWTYPESTPGYSQLATATFSNSSPTFARASAPFGQNGNGDYTQHPSFDQVAAPADFDRMWLLDALPFLNSSSGYTGSATLIDGESSTYKYVPQRSLRRKQLTTMASCGAHPLMDISGPDSAISDATPYTYCVANAGGECRSDSTAGSIYVSCPGVTKTRCDTNSRTGATDICVGDLAAYGNSAVQVSTSSSDVNGAGSRVISQLFAQNHQENLYNNVRPTSDGRWMMFLTPNLTGGWASGTPEAYMARLPQFPAKDATQRDTFVPVEVHLSASRRPDVANAVVEFGYAENGAPERFLCTSRQETCVAQGSEIDETQPFYFAQTEAGSITGQPCGVVCKIAIPAIPGRVIYYRVSLRDSKGQVVARQQTVAQAVP